ncbi:hypothetical protein AB0B07_17005 [Streptomyces sioyaensis]|uniref:hypothetical protein n=1 Tax=Streptomyces sioyaensis TaxID=67364 RepID=UPI0033DBE568
MPRPYPWNTGSPPGNDSGCCCALSLRAQRMALNVRLLLRPLKLMSVVEHKVDTVENHR